MSTPVDAPPPVGALPRLEFAVEDAAPVPYSAVPTMRLALRIECVEGPRVHSLLLDAQVRIAARLRSYGPAEQERLVELFGAPRQWATSLRSFLWTNATLFVPGFTRSTRVDLPLACTYDFEVAATRYLDALEDGEVPLELLFSGTVFHAGDGGRLGVARLPLDREASFGLPVAVWREAMEQHFPGAAWLRLQRESFERLAAYRARNAMPTWEATVDRLLAGADR